MRLAPRIFMLLLTGLLLYCTPPNRAAPLTPALSQATPDESGDEWIEDSNDHCRLLPDDCFADNDGGEDDGCPDPPVPEVGFDLGDAVIDRDTAMLDQIALDAERWKPGVMLQLTAESDPREAPELGVQRVDAVRAYLVEAGVRAGRVQLLGEPPSDLEGLDPHPCICVRLLVVGCQGDT